MNRALAILAILTILIAPAFAQEQSVKPGINERFKSEDLDPELFVPIFEGEDREIYNHRNEIINALNLKPGDNVADIGAGTGFFSFSIADEIGDGTVYAVEIAQPFLARIEDMAKQNSVHNIKTVLADDHSSNLKPESVDLTFVCDTYHHFEFPYDTLESIYDALVPGGRLVIVDFERIEGVSDDWVLEHVRCGKETVIEEVKSAGFEFDREADLMEGQYVIVFQKPRPADAD